MKQHSNFIVKGFVILAFLLLLIPFFPAKAATLQELYAQRAKLLDEISSKQKNLSLKKKEAEQLKLILAQIDRDIQSIEGKISDTQMNINTKNGEIDVTNADVKQKEGEISQKTSELHDTLILMYQTSYKPWWQRILFFNSFSELIDYNQSVGALELELQTNIEELNKLKNQLEEKKTQLDKEKSDLQTLQNQQEAFQQGLQIQQNQKQNALVSANAAQKTIEQQIADAKKMYADVNSQVYKIQAAAQRGIAGGNPNSPFPFGPPAAGTITATFGTSTPFQNFHTGVDFANVIGTPVVASAAGTVSTVNSLSYGYGNYVIISHDSSWQTLYGHFMSFAVSSGQHVEKGQVIGYIGMTGWTTGPHVHFEIRYNGVPVDPMAYL